MGDLTAQNAHAVGAELAAVLPNDGIVWYRKSHLLRLNLCIFFLVFFSAATGYDGSLMNGLQSLEQWKMFMGSPKGAWLGFINAASLLGGCTVYPLITWICAQYGRKMGIAFGYFWLLLGAGVQAGATNPVMFTFGRLLVGGASSCFDVCAPCLITEIAYPTHRGVLTALYNTAYYVGSLIAAWTTFGTRNYSSSWAWRLPSLLQVCVPVAAFTGLVVAPESPRWLASKGQNDEARAFLAKYHADGDENAPLVAFELEEIEVTQRLERESKETTTYLGMMKTSGNRHRLFITISLGIAAQWNGVGVVSYYLPLVLETAGITSVTKQTLINGCLAIWNVIIGVGAASMVDRLGRRFLFLSSCIGMLISYILITGLAGSFASTGDEATGFALVAMLFLYYGSYDIAFTPLIISYPTEIWPFALRARGLAVVNLSTQLAAFFNIFVNPIAFESIHWKYYIVFVVLLVVLLATCYFFYPETRGHSLEEMVLIFDKDTEVFPRGSAIIDALPGDPDMK